MAAEVERRTGARRVLRAAARLFALGLIGTTLLAHADTVVIGDQVQVRASELPRPSAGMTMAAVEAKFGAPQQRHEAVGKPPITRWDYARFSVFFEKDRVIDAVVAPEAEPPATPPADGAPTTIDSSAAAGNPP